jgi:hypothetical protein
MEGIRQNGKAGWDDQTYKDKEHFPVPVAFRCKDDLFHFFILSND